MKLNLQWFKDVKREQSLFVACVCFLGWLLSPWDWFTRDTK